MRFCIDRDCGARYYMGHTNVLRQGFEPAATAENFLHQKVTFYKRQSDKCYAMTNAEFNSPDFIFVSAGDFLKWWKRYKHFGYEETLQVIGKGVA